MARPPTTTDLDERCTIRTSTTTVTGSGHEKQTWSDAATDVPCSFTLEDPSEQLRRGRIDQAQLGIWTSRYRTDVTAASRIVRDRDSTTWEVIGDPIEIGRQAGLKAKIRRIANA